MGRTARAWRRGALRSHGVGDARAGGRGGRGRGRTFAGPARLAGLEQGDISDDEGEGAGKVEAHVIVQKVHGCLFKYWSSRPRWISGRSSANCLNTSTRHTQALSGGLSHLSLSHWAVKEKAGE